MSQSHIVRHVNLWTDPSDCTELSNEFHNGSIPQDWSKLCLMFVQSASVLTWRASVIMTRANLKQTVQLQTNRTPITVKPKRHQIWEFPYFQTSPQHSFGVPSQPPTAPESPTQEKSSTHTHTNHHASSELIRPQPRRQLRPRPETERELGGSSEL